MSVGINREEMLDAANTMHEMQEWHGKIKPLIDKYEQKIEHWLIVRDDICADSTPTLYAEISAKIKVYKEIAKDLDTIIPKAGWLN